MALSPSYHLWDKFHASKTGIATPKQDMDIVRNRLKAAEAFIKELRHGQEDQ